MSKKAPSADDLYIAAQWLIVYEGAEDAESCHRVAAWLLEQSDKAEFRETCRSAGVSVSQARKAIKRKEQAK